MVGLLTSTAVERTTDKFQNLARLVSPPSDPSCLRIIPSVSSLQSFHNESVSFLYRRSLCNRRLHLIALVDVSCAWPLVASHVCHAWQCRVAAPRCVERISSHADELRCLLLAHSPPPRLELAALIGDLPPPAIAKRSHPQSLHRTNDTVIGQPIGHRNHGGHQATAKVPPIVSRRWRRSRARQTPPD